MSKVDWDEVYNTETPRLYNYFRYRTGDSETAKDLTSRTMMKAWRYRKSYDHNRGAFTAWVFQIARNLASDYLRQLDKAPLPLYDVQHHQAEFSLENEVQKNLDARHLYCLIKALPLREQEIVSLKFGADMTNVAIAEMLNLSPTNVSTILQRTIQQLRAKWELNHVTE